MPNAKCTAANEGAGAEITNDARVRNCSSCQRRTNTTVFMVFSSGAFHEYLPAMKSTEISDRAFRFARRIVELHDRLSKKGGTGWAPRSSTAALWHVNRGQSGGSRCRADQTGLYLEGERRPQRSSGDRVLASPARRLKAGAAGGNRRRHRRGPAAGGHSGGHHLQGPCIAETRQRRTVRTSFVIAFCISHFAFV